MPTISNSTESKETDWNFDRYVSPLFSSTSWPHWTFESFSSRSTSPKTKNTPDSAWYFPVFSAHVKIFDSSFVPVWKDGFEWGGTWTNTLTTRTYAYVKNNGISATRKKYEDEAHKITAATTYNEFWKNWAANSGNATSMWSRSLENRFKITPVGTTSKNLLMGARITLCKTRLWKFFDAEQATCTKTNDRARVRIATNATIAP